MHSRTCVFCVAYNVQRRYSVAAWKSYLMNFAIAFNFNFHRFWKCIDNRNAHAVQAATDFVTFASEFAARVQNS